MKHIHIYLILLSILSIVLPGCVPQPLDVTLPEQKSRLVVSSVVIPNQVMFVSLTRSFTSLANPTGDTTGNGDTTFYKKFVVDSALVTVSYRGQTDTLRRVAPGIYASLNTLQVSGELYTLFARDLSTGDEITAQSQMMPKVTFDSVHPYIVRTAKDTTVYIKYSFKDRPGENNYYMVNYNVVTKPAGLSSSSFPGLGNSNFQAVDLFTEIQTNADGRIEVDKPLDINQHDTLQIQLVHISRGFYDFMNAYSRSSKLVNQLTSSTINYPTNVQNGYGYFNTHYPDVYFFDLSKY